MKMLKAAPIFAALALWSVLALLLGAAWSLGSFCVAAAWRCRAVLCRHPRGVPGARP